MDAPQIQIASALDRPTQREQIDEILGKARDKGEPVRLRLPLALYGYGQSRNYVDVRDAAWNLQLPTDATAEQVEEIIQTLQAFMNVLGVKGASELKLALEEMLLP